MKKLLPLIALIVLGLPALGNQVTDTKVIREIKIEHADPYLIYLLLAGELIVNLPPEISTLSGGFGGFGGGRNFNFGSGSKGPGFG